VRPTPSDDERAKKILDALKRVPDRPPRRHNYTWFVLLTTVVLVGAIAFVVLTNRERFAFLYHHMATPDSLPAAGE
jgi:hypothetical protein